METALNVLSPLPRDRLAALAAYPPAGPGYATFAKRRSTERPSVLATTNRIRRQWMLQATYREVRHRRRRDPEPVNESVVLRPTTILIIGGLLAVPGRPRRRPSWCARSLCRAHLGARVRPEDRADADDLHYAFFRFTWSMRQYTFGALMVAAAPEAEALTRRAPKAKPGVRPSPTAPVAVGMAAETFNDGLRAYFRVRGDRLVLLPVVLCFATGVVVYILYQREFRPDVLEVLHRSGRRRRACVPAAGR